LLCVPHQSVLNWGGIVYQEPWLDSCCTQAISCSLRTKLRSNQVRDPTTPSLNLKHHSSCYLFSTSAPSNFSSHTVSPLLFHNSSGDLTSRCRLTRHQRPSAHIRCLDPRLKRTNVRKDGAQHPHGAQGMDMLLATQSMLVFVQKLCYDELNMIYFLLV
jgi:hypothetical protein